MDPFHQRPDPLTPLQHCLLHTPPHCLLTPHPIASRSVNGTFLNCERVDSERYYELLEQDMFKFAHSSREYVLLHDQSSLGAGD